MKPQLSVRHLSKHFGHFAALSDVSLEVGRGEMHCLLGENGAGKSTLTGCISGYLRCDSGAIEVEGRPVEIHSPLDACRLGIGMVHQHFVLVPTLTVVENVIAGTPGGGVFLRKRQTRAALAALCERYGLRVPLDAPVESLDVGEQQWAEILKCLYLSVKLLILDEPTAVLTPQESARLFAMLRELTRQGTAVLLITHKLDEVLQCDRVTVMRKGHVVTTVETVQCDKADLSRFMVGRVTAAPLREARGPGAARLELRNVCAAGGRRAIRDVSFSVRRGEIVGIAGVSGNGQKELFEIIAGVRSADSGHVLCDGADVTNASPAAISRAGIGHVPQDRYAEGLIGDFSVVDNLTLGRQRDRRFSRFGFVLREEARRFAEESVERFSIATRSVDTAVKALSGGNAQKIIIARELFQASKVLLANQPTRGVDIGVIESIYQLLLQKRREGYAILLASDELDDLFALSDRIAVMYEGRIVGMFASESVSIEQVGHLMAGGSESASFLEAQT